MKRTSLVLVLSSFVVAGLGASAQEPTAPPPLKERMFYALLNPDSTASLQIECPSTLVESDDWWHVCGKFFVLASDKWSPGPNAVKRAWRKARDEVAHLVLDPDMTYANWSGGSPALRDSIRVRLLERVRTIVDNNKVFEALDAATAPGENIAAVLELKQSDLRGIPQDDALFHYCPGATGNIATNQHHPLFQKWVEALRKPGFIQFFNEVSEEYQKRLLADGRLDATARQQVLNDLLKEKKVISQLQ